MSTTTRKSNQGTARLTSHVEPASPYNSYVPCADKATCGTLKWLGPIPEVNKKKKHNYGMNYVTVVIPGKIYSATQSLGTKVSKPAIGVHTEEPFWSVNANNCSCSLSKLCIKLLSMTYELMMSRVIQGKPTWVWVVMDRCACKH